MEIKDLKVGMWITFNSYQVESNHNLIKIAEIKADESVKGSNWIFKDYKHNTGTWGKQSMSNIQPASMELVYKHFPEERPKEEYRYHCVECTTEEQWLFVKGKTGNKSIGEFNRETTEGKATTICFDGTNKGDIGCYCSKEWYLANKANIISFDEYCQKFGFKLETMTPSTELSSLPKKWFIALNNDNKETVGKWRTKLMPEGFVPPVELKEKEYIIGKWYKQGGYYGKLTGQKRSNGEFPSTEYIGSTGKYTNTGSFFSGWYSPEEAMLEEIQQYLPEGHVDKIKTMETFKEGDWVVLQKMTQNHNSSGMDCDIGKCVQLTDKNFTNSYDSPTVNVPNKNGSYWVWILKYGGFRRAHPHEIPSMEPKVNTHVFKVGDEVIGNHDTAYDITKKGWIGKVTEVKDWQLGNIYVQSLDGRQGPYPVESKYFDLYSPKGVISEQTGLPKMSKEEELLIEAKKRYPVGTIVKKMGANVGGKFGFECRFTDWKYWSDSGNFFIDNNLLIYMNGKWAEIVEMPKIHVEEQESYIKNIELKGSKKDGRIDTSVNTINSVSVQLVKPKKVVYF
jgi:hypothetical protein